VQVQVSLFERNILVGGEPGGGKSGALNLIVAHAALSPDCRLVMFDAKRVELGLWSACVAPGDFVRNDQKTALDKLTELCAEMDRRYDWLENKSLRKITRDGPFLPIVVVIDELAYYTSVAGTKTQRELFISLCRDLVARGRAAGIIMVIATQRPSADIVPTSLRDLFGYRWAMRCTTEASSDVILGFGWAKLGYSATDIDPLARGVGYLLAEGGIPGKVKAAYLDDVAIRWLADYAARLREYPAESGAESGWAA
jgi:S-DNA-T family DNA segregation ATPase FtsK/SpoIIIE